ncbi:helix-turn-helix and ligand-binding sensor domain-containing protein [Ascidiimonas aurantiaca]|uniref:helix-turn-helix and ligand-binding sensor domain-containing protein n=1 Tax=Ascidiimonas aurantiaca TaxID=1685432 RepID=UPI0030ED152B
MKIVPGFILLFLMFFSFGQEHPPIVEYTTSTYKGDNQNWMVSQDIQKQILVANNAGLLVFNGEEWEQYPSPNETILRSVVHINGKIYTGAYMEFGFWEPDVTGKLKYSSLSKNIQEQIIDDEEFWNIFSYGDQIIFQSLDRIYTYHSEKKKFGVITPKTGVTKMFQPSGALMFQGNDNILYEVESGEIKPLSTHPEILRNRIINIFDSPEGYLVLTNNEGFYRLTEEGLQKWYVEIIDGIEERITAYSGIRLSNGDFAIGTISHGVFILTAQGVLKYHMSQIEGLTNNTVLSMYEDVAGNLWMGLDNGINCINLNSPVRRFIDNTGILGTVYGAVHHDKKLYVGTNQGLFVKEWPGANSFRLVQGTRGQVWSLFVHENTLFCGHDLGTFIISEDKSAHISTLPGTWKFNPIPGKPNLLLQGTYNGFSVLQREGNSWRFKNKVTGFEYSSRYFEFASPQKAFMSHEYKGVFDIRFDEKYEKVNRVTKLESPDKGKNASLVKFNEAIFYASRDGVFKKSPRATVFTKDTILSKLFDQERYVSGKLVADATGKMWFFTKNGLTYVSPGKLSSELQIHTISIPILSRKSMDGFENVTHIGNHSFLFGTTNGYFVLYLDRTMYEMHTVSLTKTEVSVLDKKSQPVALNVPGDFEYNHNTISFSYAVADFNGFNTTEYQYKLEGLYEEWSEWSHVPKTSFDNLPYGEYTFYVRSRTGDELSSNTAVYRFKIRKPWYFSSWAIVFYAIGFILLGLLIHSIYKVYYRKQQEKLVEANNKKMELQRLASERELIKVKNEQLRQDIESKNRELAASAMNLINKNELLGQIKKQLVVEDDLKSNIKSVIRTIDRNVSEEDNWNAFKEAFNNADKDFLKKVKQKHPVLTPNDLRLCAYLRLNLSSKEIAPLLNISPRSVEIKRYRLRKKIELAHEKSLVEYIMEM